MKKLVISFLFFSLIVLGGVDNLKKLSKKGDKFIGKFPYVILLDESEVKVNPSGMNLRSEKKAVKLLSVEGCKKFYSLSFFYDPLTMILKVSDAKVVKKDGSEKIIDLKQIKYYPQPARAIYWPNIRVTIPYGFLEPGDIIVYELEKKGFSYALLADSISEDKFAPPMKGHFYDIVFFQEYYPVLHQSYAVIFPKGKIPQYKFYNGEVNASSMFTDYGMKYVFEKNDIPALKREPSMVAIADVGYKLLISTTVKWEDKSEWFYNVNENYSFKVIPEVRAKVDELIKNAKTDEEKVDILNHWVAHYIRYSGLSMGEGEGFTLHPSDMILRDRSGVCKDKASLLITFLRAAGFEAFPAMTFAGAKIDNFPADFFNHCVVALREKDGNFKMLDPTWVPWVREQWSSAEQEQQYLVGYKVGQKLMTTPYSAPKNHYYKINSRCVVDKLGNLRGNLKISCEGQTDSRMRRYLQKSSTKLSDAYFKRIVFSIYPNAVIKKLVYQNPWDISKHMTAEVDFSVNDFQIKGEENAYFKSPSVSYVAHDNINREFSRKLPNTKRKFGYRTSCTKLITINEEIKFPKALDKDEVVFPENISHKGDFADLEVSYSVKDNVISTKGKIMFKRRVYPAEGYSDLREVINGFIKLSEEYICVEKGAVK